MTYDPFFNPGRLPAQGAMANNPPPLQTPPMMGDYDAQMAELQKQGQHRAGVPVVPRTYSNGVLRPEYGGHPANTPVGAPVPIAMQIDPRNIPNYNNGLS